MFWITRGNIITSVSRCRFRCVFSLIFWWNNCFLLRKSRSPTLSFWRCHCLWITNSHTSPAVQWVILRDRGWYSVVYKRYWTCQSHHDRSFRPYRVVVHQNESTLQARDAQEAGDRNVLQPPQKRQKVLPPQRGPEHGDPERGPGQTDSPPTAPKVAPDLPRQVPPDRLPGVVQIHRLEWRDGVGVFQLRGPVQKPVSSSRRAPQTEHTHDPWVTLYRRWRSKHCR